MNKERILDLANKIEAMPDKKFTMADFMHRPKASLLSGQLRHSGYTRDVVGMADEFLNECGTAGCIAGWTVAFYGRSDAPYRNTVESEAAELLGLTDVEAAGLFYGTWSKTKYLLGNDLSDITKAETVQFLRDLAEGRAKLL